MKIFVENISKPLRFAQAVFNVLGLWPPTDTKGPKKLLFHFYTFLSFLFVVGTYIIIQVGDLCVVWGNVELMTGTIFLLLTNLSLLTKAVNVYCRKTAIKAVIEEAHTELSAEYSLEGKRYIESCNRETKIQLNIYLFLTCTTVGGWAISAEKDQLPMRAWYPYDTTKTPAYQLTYAHQCIALSVAACLNICVDTLVTTLMSQCCCRFNLLSLSLRTLCKDLHIPDQGLLSPADEAVVWQRVRRCIRQHQAILNQTVQLQEIFSIPELAQFSVSLVIICVTAYQMAIAGVESLVWLIAMVAYLTDMLMQVFIYCYHGNQLVIESGKVAVAVYFSPWYLFSPALRRCLLLVMARAQSEVRLRAGGLTDLSLATFMAILKASYSLFTVLQQAADDDK